MGNSSLIRTAYPLRILLLVLLALLPACSISLPTVSPAPTRSLPSPLQTGTVGPPSPSQPSLPTGGAPAAPLEASPGAGPLGTSSPATVPPASPASTLSGIYLPAAGWPSIQPIGDFYPLPEGDPFAREMQSSGYSLFQAGSLTAEGGSIYAAYIFTRLKAGEPVGRDTFRLAFYRWDGSAATRLADFSPAAYSPHLPVYPSYYRLVNWDDPTASQMGLLTVEDPAAAVRSALRLSGHAADINANRRPEFIFAAAYCPDSCAQPISGLDYFEVGPQEVVDLSAGLPGRLSLSPVSAQPLVFETVDAYRFGANAYIYSPALVAWNGEQFAEVTAQHAAALEERIAAHRLSLESGYGGRFEVDALQADAYNLLLLYERLGRSQSGLEAFLEVTDSANWAPGNVRMRCWLQLARALAQDEQNRRVAFTLLPPVSAFHPDEAIPEMGPALRDAGYDLSACSRWLE